MTKQKASDETTKTKDYPECKKEYPGDVGNRKSCESLQFNSI